MAQNDADNIVTISDAPVQFQQDSEEQNKIVKAKGDKAQQKAIREANEQKADNNQPPITEQPQTLDTNIQGAEGVSEPIQAQATNKQEVAPPTDSTNINVEQFNEETEQVIGNEDAARKARREKGRLLDRAIKSLDKKTLVQKMNVLTQKVVAEYIKYLPDETGKTVFDYMKDDAVAQHIVFQFPEGKTEADKDKLTAPITPFWIDANY